MTDGQNIILQFLGGIFSKFAVTEEAQGQGRGDEVDK